MIQTNGQGGSADAIVDLRPSAERLDAAKAALRRQAKETRAEAHARLRSAAARAIADAFLATVPLPVRSVVAGYLPIGDELDPLVLMTQLSARGLICAVPVVEAKGRPLIFREWTPETPLRPGPFGVRVPGADAAVLKPSLLLVPLLAFDRTGRRMGYGGGFYDRTLAALRADGAVVAVGLAYAAQEVAEVPAEAHDQRLDWLVTEQEVLSFSPLGGFDGGDRS